MWNKKPIHWEDDKYHYYSIVFSWDLWEWAQKIQPEFDGKKVMVGGPAVKLNPSWVPEWAEMGGDCQALWRHNPEATRTSTGCIRKCPFCAVPEMEGRLAELEYWAIKPIVIDNNLLACSEKHFDKVIDSLKSLEWCDFNQGLDARLLTQHHADRFAELKNPMIRLAFDDSRYEKSFMKAVTLLRDAGIAKKNIQVYVLIGFNDTPEDALCRLSKIRGMGLLPNPMRYQPVHAKKRNEYVGEAWAHRELTRFMRYWANLRYTAGVPFEEFA